MTNEAAVPFLSNTPARPWDRRIAGAVVVLALLGFALAAPFAKTLWPAIPAFIPAYEAALVLNDLITAILLFTQFRQLRTPSLLILGSAYLFNVVVIGAHALSFPGAFTEAGLLGGHEHYAHRPVPPWPRGKKPGRVGSRSQTSNPRLGRKDERAVKAEAPGTCVPACERGGRPASRKP